MFMFMFMLNNDRSNYNRKVVENAARSDKIAKAVAALIAEGDYPGIVFVRTKRHVEALASAIAQAISVDPKSISVTAESMTKEARQQLAERLRLRDATVPAVVATSVWSRGIDIPGLRWVMLAGGGRAPIWLVQSAGRALRKAGGKPGYRIISVVDDDDARLRQQHGDRMSRLSSEGFAIAFSEGLQALTPSRQPAIVSDGNALLQLMQQKKASGSISGSDLASAGGGPRPSRNEPKISLWLACGGWPAFWFFLIAGMILTMISKVLAK